VLEPDLRVRVLVLILPLRRHSTLQSWIVDAVVERGRTGRESNDTSVRRRSTIEPPVAVPFYAFRVVRARRSEVVEDTI
jgi:hypothetical protein